MNNQLTHLEIEELLGAYALDAVSAEEAALLEAHLEECPRCRAEVESHREAVSLLAHAGAPAPAGLWDRIADSLDAPAPPPERLASVRPLVRPRRPRIGGVVTAAAAAVAVLLGLQAQRLDSRLEQLQAAAARDGLHEAATAALLDREARRVDLRSDDGRLQAVAVLADDGNGYLLRSNLPRLAEDRTYQLWAVVGDRKVSVGVLGPRPSVGAFRYDGQPIALAVTEERDGGVVAPERAPVLVGFVPRSA